MLRCETGYYSVEVKLEVRHNMLIAAHNEEEAISVAFSESIPVDSLDDFDREVIRTVQMKERVYVS
jgi:hypothetical protein